MSCFIIPLWGLGIISTLVCAIGIYLGYKYITEFEYPEWVMYIAAILVPIGGSVAMSVVMAYITPVILPYLPCITVIP